MSAGTDVLSLREVAIEAEVANDTYYDVRYYRFMLHAFAAVILLVFGSPFIIFGGQRGDGGMLFLGYLNLALAGASVLMSLFYLRRTGPSSERLFNERKNTAVAYVEALQEEMKTYGVDDSHITEQFQNGFPLDLSVKDFDDELLKVDVRKINEQADA
jgi:hypothetical protein